MGRRDFEDLLNNIYTILDLTYYVNFYISLVWTLKQAYLIDLTLLQAMDFDSLWTNIILQYNEVELQILDFVEPFDILRK